MYTSRRCRVGLKEHRPAIDVHALHSLNYGVSRRVEDLQIWLSHPRLLRNLKTLLNRFQAILRR